MIKIKDIKQNKDKFILTIEHNYKEVILTTSEDVLLKYNILSPKEIDIKLYSSLLEEIDTDEYFNKAIVYCSYQLRSVASVKSKLRKLKCSESDINDIITRLKELNYLDDYRYAKTITDETIQFKVNGPNYVKDKLIKDKIHHSIIEEVLVLYTEVLEEEKIALYLDKEFNRVFKDSKTTVLNKYKRNLITKGFRLSVINKVLQYKKELLNIDEHSNLRLLVHKNRNKYDLKNKKDYQKAVSYYYSKGYKIDDIKKVLMEDDYEN